MKLIIILLFALYTAIITPAADDAYTLAKDSTAYITYDRYEFPAGSNVFLSAETEFGNSVRVIGGPLYILGKSRIGNGCVLYPFSVITECILEDNVIVHPHSVLENSTFKSNSQIGPFAHVCEGSIIGEGAVIGTFVQVKRSEIGTGTKAKHLAYLGNTQTGQKVNIGGGTITANYNGVEKLPTFIDDNAFIGSNTTLVAPVTIRKDAFIAAGSTITEDVRDGDFAIARSYQTNKAGYAAQLMAKFRALKDKKEKKD